MADTCVSLGGNTSFYANSAEGLKVYETQGCTGLGLRYSIPANACSNQGPFSMKVSIVKYTDVTTSTNVTTTTKIASGVLGSFVSLNMFLILALAAFGAVFV